MNPPPPAPDAENSPGLPGLRTWRSVYWLVAGIFAVYVILLAALTSLNS